MTTEIYVPIFSIEEEAQIEQAYQELREAYLRSNHRKKIEVIDRAFTLARIAHGAVRRRSGEPYILHPIAVARIVCEEMGLGSTSIVCALLHDVVEDTQYTLEDIRKRFGDKVAVIVDGLTKVSEDSISFEGSAQKESLRKILVAMGHDARVVLIKLADRLHNMRTLGSMLASKRYKIAGETQYIYVPLAHRLGLHAIKTELEDLSFKNEHPETYDFISQKVKETKDERDELLKQFTAPIERRLKEEGISYDLKMRVKSNYSIWRKMETKGIPFEEVYDVFAVRIVFDNKDAYPENKRCFDIYTVITSLYRANSERIRDWVSTPKNNGYRALHVTVMGPNGRWIEVQIRSRIMDEVAERGLAAHWRYKKELVEEDKEITKWLDTVRDVVKEPTPHGMDFLDTFMLSLNPEEVWVFTPKGDSIRLPAGATVLDLAYEIHSELGDHCIGAKIRGKVVSYKTKLKQGDQVEILHSKTIYPTSEWLGYVLTPKARLGVSSALRRRAKEEALKGEEILRDKCTSLGWELNNRLIDKLLSYYQYAKREELFRSIGVGRIDLDRDMIKFMRLQNEQKGQMWDISPSLSRRSKRVEVLVDPEPPKELRKIDRKQIYVLTGDSQQLNYKVATCCRPIPRDEAFGIVKNEEVYVHKLACPVAIKTKSIEGNNIITTRWGEHYNTYFETTLIFRGLDQIGVLHSITDVLSTHKHINISGISVRSKDGLFSGRISVMVSSADEVEEICGVLRQHASILSIHRLAEETLKRNKLSKGLIHEG